MMRVLLAVLVLTTVQVCATRRRLPFNANKIVTCGLDAVDEKPSDVPIIPIVANAPDQFWPPESISVRPPTGSIYYKELEEQYMDLYGVSFNSTFTAVVPPPDIQFTREPIMSEQLIDGELINRTTDDLTRTYGQVAQELVRLNNLLRCDLDIVLEWMKLPDYYYPPYVVAGRCVSPQPCGYPPDAGYRCQPDTRNTLLVDVIRWDCCYVMIDRWWMRHCGWRHVQIESIIHCSCRCSGVVS